MFGVLFLFVKGVKKELRPSFKEQLRELQKKQKKERSNEKPNQNEVLSRREIEDLMGIHRPTYKRHRGAYRQQ